MSDKEFDPKATVETMLALNAEIDELLARAAAKIEQAGFLLELLDAHYNQQEAPPFERIVDSLPQHPTKRHKLRTLDLIKQIVIHHAGDPINAVIPPENIANYHVNKRQYPGMAYHFYVRKSGQVFQCQDLETVSWHCGGWCNTVSVGICLEGNWNKTQPGRAQLAAARALVAWLWRELGAPLPVVGHQEVVETACPGYTWPLWSGKLLP